MIKDRLFQEHSSSIAIRMEKKELTYKQVMNLAIQLSLDLQDKYKIRQGDVLFHIFSRSFEMVISLLAGIYLGTTYCPFHPSDPWSRIQPSFELLHPPVILTSKEVILDSSIPLYSVQLDEFDSEKEYTHSSSVSEEDSILYIIHTSGTTGHPKGIRISESSFLHVLDKGVYSSPISYDYSKKVLQLSRSTFDVHILEILGTLIYRGTLVLIPDYALFDMSYLYSIITDNSVTNMDMTPTLLSTLLSYCISHNLHCPSLRHLMMGGEPCSSYVIKSISIVFPFLEKLSNMYGPAECTINAMGITYVSPFNQLTGPLSIGSPLHGFQIRVEEQELWISGIGLMKGYIFSQLNTRQLIYKDNLLWYRTGDIVEQKDEQWYYKGRNDFQIKWKGQRIELEEIEQTIECFRNDIYHIRHAIVKCEENELVAYLEMSSFPILSWEDELFHHCKTLLSSFMIPTVIRYVEQFNQTPNGKINKTNLPPFRTISRTTTLSNHSFSVDDILSTVSSIVETPVFLDSHLFEEVGVDSRSLGLLVSRCKEFLPSISISFIVHHPTVREWIYDIPSIELDSIEGIYQNKIVTCQIWKEQYRQWFQINKSPSIKGPLISISKGKLYKVDCSYQGIPFGYTIRVSKEGIVVNSFVQDRPHSCYLRSLFLKKIT